MVNVMQLERHKDERVRLAGDYVHFHVWGNAADYVGETAELMQQMAKRCFAFPFYVHVETYSDQDSVQEMLAFQKHVEMTYSSTGKKIWAMRGGVTVYEEMPSFSLQVKDAKGMKLVFKEWFHLAQQNQLWVMSQNADVYYEDGILVFHLQEDAVVLIADHDGYGFSVLTNAEGLKEKSEILALYGV